MNCGPSQSVSRARVMPEALALPVSYHADGRASDTWTWHRCSSSWWRSTTHFDSANPFGLVSSARTSGCGTCMPSACSAPAMVDVPLRPEPTTKTTRRLLSDTGGSLMAGHSRRDVGNGCRAALGTTIPHLDANGRAQSTRSVWAAMNWRYQSKERLGVRFWVSKSTWTRPKRWV